MRKSASRPSTDKPITGMTERSFADALQTGTAAFKVGASGLLVAFTEPLAAERERWELWLPVGLGFGIAWYFWLPTEPTPWLGAGMSVALAGIALVMRRKPAWLAVTLVLLTGALGFTAAQIQTWGQRAPMVSHELGIVTATGRVITTESMPDGVRLTLSDVTIDRLPPESTPDQIRIGLKGRFTAPPPGAMIRVRAQLHPSATPAEPGAYDFQRQAFFDGNGAVGSALETPDVIEGPPPSSWRGLMLQMEALRALLHQRCVEILPDPATSTVTEALLNGEQTAIPQDVMNDYRYSGLAHLLSISGLHIALVAGLVYFLVRALLASIEPVALRYPIKKWAALAGLLAAFAYLALVGPAAPTLRSVLSTGTVMIAIMADRNPISMRLLMISAVVILAYTPEQMLGPSFQMSFAAVGALITTYEVANSWLQRWRTETGALGQAGLYLIGSVLTSVVATLATLPFSLYHFQQMALYGVLSNMIAVPLTTFWVMPWALAVYVLLPFGLDAWALIPMGWGVAACNWLAHVTAALPGSVLWVPAMPVTGLAAIVLGGLWLMLWRERWRLWGLLPITLGFASILAAPHPDLLISSDGAVMAVRMADGGLSFNNAKAAKGLVGQTWLHRDGTNQAAEPWPAEGHSADDRLSCDEWGCLYRAGEITTTLVRDRMALDEDCETSNLMVAADPVHGCPGPVIIDFWSLRHNGAYAVWLSDGHITTRSVTPERGNRPWTAPR